jgi:hypothetical protein
MKTLKWSLLLVLVLGVGISAVMLRTRSPHPPVAVGNEPNQTVEAVGSSSFAIAPVRQSTATAWLRRGKSDSLVVDIPSVSAELVRVHVDKVLAKVNERPVLLKDLVVLRADEQEQTMTQEEYESRLNRAIEMELTFHAAAAQGVDLTPQQKKQVDGIAQKHDLTLREYQKQGITWSSLTTAQLEFEKRLTSALLLQQNLVAMEANVAPSSDPNVQARYEQARGEVLSRLKASNNITLSPAGI